MNYRYEGRAEESGAGRSAFGNTRRESVAYDLVPLYSTLWARAHGGANQTFGDDFAYAKSSVRARQQSGDDAGLDVVPGALGASFRGAVGGRNMARPPWGWFDSSERERPLGEWFLDPAQSDKNELGPATRDRTRGEWRPSNNLTSVI
ncbi:MAG: hypothetical protein OSB03_04205 [Vicinamibacterales bacterium]|nr:hypothetical protein [Vicinamibacterales bacterium]